eukprot:SAG31_NODE_703_length_12720_cov_10.185088_6_plen_712_part_00
MTVSSAYPRGIVAGLLLSCCIPHRPFAAAPEVGGARHARQRPPKLRCPTGMARPAALRTDDVALPATVTNLLSNPHFDQAGSTEGEPAAGWMREGDPGYSVASGVRHGTGGASLEVRALNTSTLAGAVQVIVVPADGTFMPRRLRVSGWSRVVAVSSPASDGYAISCDLTFADGTHHYGAAVARFHTGSDGDSWQQAQATFMLPASGPELHSIAYYLLFRGHVGSALFSDVSCTLEGGAPDTLHYHAIYAAYNAGSWTADCPDGCPETNSFGRSNFSNVFFGPFLDLVTDNATICPADFSPDLQDGTCLPDPAEFAAGSKLVPVGRRALWMASFPVAMCSAVRTRSSTVGDCTRDAPCSPAMTQCFSNTTCGYWLDELGANGFVGPWSEVWQRQSAARFDWWMGQYKQHGGTLDLLYMDAEDRPGPDEMSWSFVSASRNGSGAMGSEDAIMADARWATLRDQLSRLAKAVGCPWPETTLRGWREWYPSDCRVLVWNEVAQNMSAAALDAAIFEPIRKHFPKAQGTNFAHWHTDPLSPETWAFGFEGLTATGIGFGSHAGTHSSGSWYAEPVFDGSHHSEFGFDVSAQLVVALPDKRTSNGTTRAQPSAFCETVDVTAWNQLVYDTRKARNIHSGNSKAAHPANGTIAWVAPKRGMDVVGKGYNSSPGIYHNSDYYQEALYHIALSGCVQTFIYCKILPPFLSTQSFGLCLS